MARREDDDSIYKEGIQVDRTYTIERGTGQKKRVGQENVNNR
jgi:hypothetical protein